MVAKVVPESCQRTDGIKAWLETKEEKEIKRLEKEERRREKEDQLNKITEGRVARNAERQRENEMRKLEKLMKRNSILDSGAIKESEFILKELNEIIDNKGIYLVKTVRTVREELMVANASAGIVKRSVLSIIFDAIDFIQGKNIICYSEWKTCTCK